MKSKFKTHSNSCVAYFNQADSFALSKLSNAVVSVS